MCSRFCYYFLYIFHKNELFWIKPIPLTMKNYKELQKTWTHFFTAVLCETLYKISRQTGKSFWYWRSENMITYDFYLFPCFASSSPLKFSWNASFNLARSTCFFYWCYIFSFVIIFFFNNLLKISIQKEKHMLLYSYRRTGIFTVKHLCLSLFLIKLQSLSSDLY